MLELASWSAGGRSERGSHHARAGEPNQDAVAFREGAVALIAVADGHGSARHPRSDVGAAFAVAVAGEVLPAFAADPGPANELRAALAEAVVAGWRQRVLDHLADHPLSAEEATRVAGSRLGAYGTTLLAVVAHGESLLAVQIGDGEVWLADDGGARRLLARDLRYALHSTASLCMDRAADEVRIVRALVEGPALAVVATDGFARPLATDGDVAAAVAALYGRVRALGFSAALDGLPLDLARASACGGDDVSLGMLYRA